MTKLRCQIVEKLEKENKTTNPISGQEAFEIFLSDNKRMTNYYRTYTRRNHASHENASRLILC